MTLPRYPEYKASGVEWLGEVPAHWEIRKLRSLARLESGHTPSRQHPEWWIEQDCVIPWFTLADVSYLREERNWRIESTSQKISRVGMENSAARLLPQDAVLLSRTASVGFSGVAAIELAVSQDFAAWICGPRLRPFYVLLCLRAMKQEFGRLMMGSTHQTIYMPDIEAFRVPVPAIPEQDRIAEFLDRETAKIFALVSEQQRLIELLKEKRQAVISHAVTKGLNPNAPMKDSGIEWLGEVPAHWRVGKCGFYLRVLSGFAFPSSGFTDDESAPKLLRGINVGVSRLKWDEVVRWHRAEGDGLDAYEMREGDLVIGMDRPLIGNGMRVARVTAGDLPCLLLQRVASLKAGPTVHAGYVFHLFSSEMFIAHFSPETTGVSVPHISPEQIGNFVIPVPPMNEQAAISAFILAETTRVQALVDAARRAIELLQERRTALISAAVTGQIDVRPRPQKA